MKLTVLGSGTSSGVPVVGCRCGVCTSLHPKNKRWRCSCLFEVEDKKILVDMGPDLRNQALTFNINRIDAVLVTHIHADHILGIDELRIYNVYQKAAIPLFGHQTHLDYIKNMFQYIFDPQRKYPSLVPHLTLTPVEGLFHIGAIPVQMIPCAHGDAGPTYNYRVGDIAWLCDTNGIPETSFDLLKNLDTLFIDGLRSNPHPTHFTINEAISVAQRIGAKKTWFIHLTHEYDHDLFNTTLPEGFALAYDGLCIEVP
ncbi:MAG: MBL fold metallo-hydrolase [Deltaproteobacteria bacterium]|nr:MBL fold metallo-hydrolase [Deltaproteobacteria bacterium]